ALALVVEAVLRAVVVQRPLRRAPVDRRHEVALARGRQVAILLRRLRLGLAPPRHGLEGRRGVRQPRDASANGREVRVRLPPHARREVDRARLVPVHPYRANGVVEEPPLLGEAPGGGVVCWLVAHRATSACRQLLWLTSARGRASVA